MWSKLILLLGLLVGAFLTFMCINENKTALSLKYKQIAENDATLQLIEPTVKVETPAFVEESEPTPTAVVELDEPLFSYSLLDNKSKLSAKFATSDKVMALEEFILSYCPAESCTQDLSFDENTKDSKWQKHALKIAAFLKDKNVKNAAVSIGGNLFSLEGELENQQDMDVLNSLLTFFDPEVYKMENLTTIAQKVEVEEVETPSVDNTQDEINRLLKANPIYFEFNSAKITTQSKETIDKVLALLKDVNDMGLTVEGHTDSSGKASYNKQLSQKRAEAVKTYLLQNGNSSRKIEAIGYGEEIPISSNPKDEINRRVKIQIKRGE